MEAQGSLGELKGSQGRPEEPSGGQLSVASIVSVAQVDIACVTRRPAQSTSMPADTPLQAPVGPEWWVKGKTGHLAPWAQALVWALVQVNEALDLEMADEDIGAFVTKVGGGPPSKTSIANWRYTFSEDPEWYPGKQQFEGKKPGPKKVLTVQKQNAIASSAMSLKREGTEPSVAEVRSRCPDATWNPTTQAPFTDKYILEVFKEKCHDDGSEVPWRQLYPYQKTALPGFLREARLVWGKEGLQTGPAAGWYFRHCMWVDPCYNILTTAARQAFSHQQASYGKGKRWMSEDMRGYSRNMRSSPYGAHQQQFGDRKVWWFVVLVRGRVHFEVMGHEWRQTGAGMSEFVARLPSILGRLIEDGSSWPRVVASDRGPGFYQSSTGHITKEYSKALKRAGFRTLAGEDASRQPPDLADVLLHETVAAWVRKYFKAHPFSRKGSIDEQEARLRSLLSECATHINENYEVEALCRSFPKRLQEVVDNLGDRLKR